MAHKSLYKKIIKQMFIYYYHYIIVLQIKIFLNIETLLLFDVKWLTLQFLKYRLNQHALFEVIWIAKKSKGKNDTWHNHVFEIKFTERSFERIPYLNSILLLGFLTTVSHINEVRLIIFLNGISKLNITLQSSQMSTFAFRVRWRDMLTRNLFDLVSRSSRISRMLHYHCIIYTLFNLKIINTFVNVIFIMRVTPVNGLLRRIYIY